MRSAPSERSGSGRKGGTAGVDAAAQHDDRVVAAGRRLPPPRHAPCPPAAEAARRPPAGNDSTRVWAIANRNDQPRRAGASRTSASTPRQQQSDGHRRRRQGKVGQEFQDDEGIHARRVAPAILASNASGKEFRHDLQLASRRCRSADTCPKRDPRRHVRPSQRGAPAARLPAVLRPRRGRHPVGRRRQRLCRLHVRLRPDGAGLRQSRGRGGRRGAARPGRRADRPVGAAGRAGRAAGRHGGARRLGACSSATAPTPRRSAW